MIDKLKDIHYIILIPKKTYHLTSPYPLIYRVAFAYVPECRDIESIRRTFPFRAATFLLLLF